MLPENGQAGVLSQLEVTPAMIAAGRCRYLELVGTVDSTYAVEEVYLAMEIARTAQQAHLVETPSTR